MQQKHQYTFSAQLWQYEGKGGWHFLSLPADMSEEIRELYRINDEGWGRMRVEAKIADYVWQTSIWFDTKSGCYLLPIKAEVRRTLRLQIGDSLAVTVAL